MARRLPLPLLVITYSCGPGVDEPGAGSRQIGDECAFDVDCGSGLHCHDGHCVARGDYVWQWGSPVVDYGSSIGAGADGVFVAGGAFGAVGDQPYLGSEDVFVTFTTRDGQQPWTVQWGTPSFEAAYGLAVAAGGGAFVAGYSRADLGVGTYAGGTDIFVVHVSDDGALATPWQWGTPGNDWAIEIAVADDRMYVVGRTDGELDGQPNVGSADAFVARLDLDGTVQWTRTLGTAEQDGGFAVAVAADGGVFMGGEVGAALPGHTFGGELDLFLARYHADGARVWTRQWGREGRDRVFGAVADGRGHVYLTGQAYHALHEGPAFGDADIVLIKVNADGERLWTHQWGSDAGEAPVGVTFAPGGDLLVTAATRGEVDDNPRFGGADILLSRITPAGERLWSRTWGGTEDDAPAGVAAAGSDIYIGGGTASELVAGSPGGGDIFLIRTRGD